MGDANQSSSCEQMHRMHDLLNEILEIQKGTQNVDQNMIRMQEIINESSKIVENSTLPNEIIVDAKILQIGSNYCNTNVSSFSTNLTSFSEEKYVSEILNFIETANELTQVGEEWKALAPFTYHLFKKSDPITFMLGPLSLQSLSETEKEEGKHKAERQKKTPQPEKNILTCSSEKEKREGSEEEGSDVYEHILKCLVKHYKKNNKKPINYFNFIIHPVSYWKTIENIFHFAFLVRDGSVKMTIENGLPFIEPVLKKLDDRTVPKSQNCQFCLTLSMSDWHKIIEKFQIKSPGIPPFVKKTNIH